MIDEVTGMHYPEGDGHTKRKLDQYKKGLPIIAKNYKEQIAELRNLLERAENRLRVCKLYLPSYELTIVEKLIEDINKRLHRYEHTEYGQSDNV